MRNCPICGRATKRLRSALWEHLEPYRPGYWQYLRGNQQTFGRWPGFWSTLYLASPLINTLRHWKHRKATLTVGGYPIEMAGLDEFDKKDSPNA